MTIEEIIQKYKDKIDYLDMEILIANSLEKTREFVLTYPEYKIPKVKIENLELNISRRVKGEPVAHLTGHKEFYGLDFMVNKHTLVPRPETELMVEQSLLSIINNQASKKITFMDIGTGSGCIITSIAHAMEHGTWNMKQKAQLRYLASDISEGALKIAEKNAKIHKVDKKIKFLQGNLLEPLLKCSIFNKPCPVIILANLPYLSKNVYNSAPVDVKKFEPKSALYSPKAGLQHYQELLKQLQQLLKKNYQLSATIFLEFSPEQKTLLNKLIKDILPIAKIYFKKDLASKWRICIINID